MAKELTTAQIFGKYYAELIEAGIDQILAENMVRDASQSLIPDEGLRVSA